MKEDIEQYIERIEITVPEEIHVIQMGCNNLKESYGGLQDLAVERIVREMQILKSERSQNKELLKHLELVPFKFKSVLDKADQQI